MTNRRCLVCSQFLPHDASARRKYCSAKCRNKATQRRYRNQQIADATATPEEILQLRKALATATDAKLQLQKTITKLREKNLRNTPSCKPKTLLCNHWKTFLQPKLQKPTTVRNKKICNYKHATSNSLSNCCNCKTPQRICTSCKKNSQVQTVTHAP